MSDNFYYAGFWRRFCAYILDAMWLMLLSFLVGSAIWGHSPIFITIQFIAQGAILGAFESSSWQATPGKKLIGIKVTDMEGERLGYWRATGRNYCEFISLLTFGVGYIMAGLTKKKQALHDMILNCLVLRTDH